MYINRKQNRGFVLGIAMIVVAVLLTLTIAISIVMLRDLRQSNISYDTRIAATLADSATMCAESVFKNFKSTSTDRSLFPTVTSLPPNVHFNSTDFPYVDPVTVGCFDVPIFPSAFTTTSSVPATTTVSNATYISTTTISVSNVSTYSGGAKVNVQIKRFDFPRFACAEIEMHTTSTGAVLIIGRGKVPCDSSSRVERVVVKRYN